MGQEPSQAMIDLVGRYNSFNVNFTEWKNGGFIISASRPSIGEVSQPELRLAGRRINPRITGPSRINTLSELQFVI